MSMSMFMPLGSNSSKFQKNALKVPLVGPFMSFGRGRSAEIARCGGHVREADEAGVILKTDITQDAEVLRLKTSREKA
jgi:hypothetical protein